MSGDSLQAVKMSEVIKQQIPGNDSKAVVLPTLYPSPQISYTLVSVFQVSAQCHRLCTASSYL